MPSSSHFNFVLFFMIPSCSSCILECLVFLHFNFDLDVVWINPIGAMCSNCS